MPTTADGRETGTVAQVLCPVMVGRDAELRLLDARLTEALTGHGSVVTVVGEAGIGKSRLAAELATFATARRALVVVGRATPAEATGAYRPLSEALSQGLRQRPVLSDERLAPWLAPLRGVVPQLATAGPPTQVAAAVRGEAIVQLLRLLAGLVFVLEDLHWADPDTLAVVEYLADNLAGASVLCVLTMRSDEPSPALEMSRRQRGRPRAAHLELDRLDADGMVEMVRACMPDANPSLLDRVRRTADGVPLLVEDLLASPGVPMSFAETVRQRLAQFDDAQRKVIDAAAVLGRRFDWQLLGPMTGQPAEVVSAALGQGVERLLLRVDDGAFRFRHALTRDAVLGELLPPYHAALATTGLATVRKAAPNLAGRWLDLAADLALRADQSAEAAGLLVEAGRTALSQGALATAIETLVRANGLTASGGPDTQLLLIEALALAGRVDEAAEVGREALDRGTSLRGRDRVEVHLRLAHAAVEAGRWPMATAHLDAARRAGTGDRRLAARADVLESEVAFAADDLGLARDKAEAALEAGTLGEVRCHALEMLGRIERFTDQAAALRRFGEALTSAESTGSAVWRMRALHEIGTIDLFDHLGTERLTEARRSAESLGALSTAAVLDLQLSAAYIARWDLARVDAHARSARDLSEALGLGDVREKAVLFLAEAAALRADVDGLERYIALSGPTGDRESSREGFCCGFRAEAALTAGDIPGAIENLKQATAILARFPHAEPASFRATWPLLLASIGAPGSADALREAHALGVAALNLNKGLMGYASAILAGRTGDVGQARMLAGDAARRFVNASTFRTLARVLAAGAAAADGWGEPESWLAEGVEVFRNLGLPGLARWCADQLAPRSSKAGITAREGDVLVLVAEGLANKEIALRLRLSVRTVEKHVEALLRKTGARTRTQLAMWAKSQTT